MIIRLSLKGYGFFLVLSLGALGCTLSSGNARDGAKSNKASQLILSSKEPHEKEQSTPNKDEQDKGEQINSFKIVRKAGWVIPGLIESNVERPRREFGSSDDPQIFFTVLNPQQEIVTELKPKTEEEKKLRLFRKKWLVDSITKYDIGGRVFCYKVFVSIVDTDDAGKIVTRYFASTAMVYYDEDGDGKFETLDLRDVLAPPRIPSWLQKDSDKDSYSALRTH